MSMRQRLARFNGQGQGHQIYQTTDTTSTNTSSVSVATIIEIGVCGGLGLLGILLAVLYFTKRRTNKKGNRATSSVGRVDEAEEIRRAIRSTSPPEIDLGKRRSLLKRFGSRDIRVANTWVDEDGLHGPQMSSPKAYGPARNAWQLQALPSSPANFAFPTPPASIPDRSALISETFPVISPPRETTRPSPSYSQPGQTYDPALGDRNLEIAGIPRATVRHVPYEPGKLSQKRRSTSDNQLSSILRSTSQRMRERRAIQRPLSRSHSVVSKISGTPPTQPLPSLPPQIHFGGSSHGESREGLIDSRESARPESVISCATSNYETIFDSWRSSKPAPWSADHVTGRRSPSPSVGSDQDGPFNLKIPNIIIPPQPTSPSKRRASMGTATTGHDDCTNQPREGWKFDQQLVNFHLSPLLANRNSFSSIDHGVTKRQTHRHRRQRVVRISHTTRPRSVCPVPEECEDLKYDAALSTSKLDLSKIPTGRPSFSRLVSNESLQSSGSMASIYSRYSSLDSVQPPSSAPRLSRPTLHQSNSKNSMGKPPTLGPFHPYLEHGSRPESVTAQSSPTLGAYTHRGLPLDERWGTADSFGSPSKKNNSSRNRARRMGRNFSIDQGGDTEDSIFSLPSPLTPSIVSDVASDPFSKGNVVSLPASSPASTPAASAPPILTRLHSPDSSQRLPKSSCSLLLKNITELRRGNSAISTHSINSVDDALTHGIEDREDATIVDLRGGGISPSKKGTYKAGGRNYLNLSNPNSRSSSPTKRSRHSTFMNRDSGGSFPTSPRRIPSSIPYPLKPVNPSDLNKNKSPRAEEKLPERISWGRKLREQQFAFENYSITHFKDGGFPFADDEEEDDGDDDDEWEGIAEGIFNFTMGPEMGDENRGGSGDQRPLSSSRALIQARSRNNTARSSNPTITTLIMERELEMEGVRVMELDSQSGDEFSGPCQGLVSSDTTADTASGSRALTLPTLTADLRKASAQSFEVGSEERDFTTPKKTPTAIIALSSNPYTNTNTSSNLPRANPPPIINDSSNTKTTTSRPESSNINTITTPTKKKLNGSHHTMENIFSRYHDQKQKTIIEEEGDLDDRRSLYDQDGFLRSSPVAAKVVRRRG